MFKIMKNNEGLYKVKIYESGEPVRRQDGFKPIEGRWMLDLDLMTACISSFKSKILTFSKESGAYRAIADYLDKWEAVRMMQEALKEKPEPEVSDTFREI